MSVFDWHYTLLRDEHGIAEGEEAVMVLFGDFVGVEDVVTPGEGTHHHQ